ncbi:hypothetical protein N7490_007743 [Penicillium lividum]|nr:hypothetical protein N7490_007743 [Penicillium lividum]
MNPRELSPVHVPLRTSSRNLLRPEKMEEQTSKMSERRTSKAQRILGTDLPIHNQGQWENPQKQQKSRRSSLRTPDSTSRQQQQNTGFVPFPTSKSGDMMVPPQNLRVRASSPLLGHEYLSKDPTPPLPKLSKKVHQSGSSSTLFSYFRSQESKSRPESPKGLQPRIQNELGLDPHITFKQARTSPKESKRKIRPPRIDLSILFPKPRNPAQPLLSPQRMTNSPSPVSTVVSDYPIRLDRESNNSSNPTSRRFGDPLPPRASVAHHEVPKQHVDRSDLLSIPESSKDEWFDQPLERTVGTSEIDLALDRYAGRRSLFSRSSVYTVSREQLQSDQRRPSETSTNTNRGKSPARNQSKDREEYLTPKFKPAPRSQSKNPPAQTWRQKDQSDSQGAKSALTKKSSKSTLKNKDLQNTSVLCLSSSDEETDEELETPITEPRHKSFCDSVTTDGDGEYEAEIYTAQAAQAATGQRLRKVDRVPSTNSRGSHTNPRQSTRQHAQRPSISSTGKSSTGRSSTNTRRTTQSRRSSGIPAIAEPNILDQLPQPPTRTPRELKEMNRRSRVIAVTRQEQDLLEAMRLRKGKVTPSMFNYGTEPDRNSVLSVPSRDSFCGSDTSFLRLSAAFPPFPTRSDQGASHMDKEGSPSQSSSSDNEQKTGNSIASMGYSESLPSPATSAASPLTPTLPIHRFSPLPSPKPQPRGPLPAIPDQKQHTRRRTDSSEAIMLNGGEPGEKQDLPLWSFDFDWNHDRHNVTAVH